MRTWDTKAIFQAAGGASQLRQALLASTGEAPDISAIYMWTQRDRIAGTWITECIAAALKATPVLTVWDLMRDDQNPPGSASGYTGEMDIE